MHIAMTPRKIFAATLTMLIVLSSMSAYAGQWDGFFFGVNTGAALSNAKYRTGPDNSGWFRQTGLTDGMWNRGDRNQSRVSPLVGLSAAYNHQVDSYVFGAELGLNAIDADLDHDGTYLYNMGQTGTYTYQQRTRLDGLLTLRGRAGIAFGDSLLSVTGGLAATQLKTGINYWDDYSGGGQYFASRTKRNFALGPTVGLAYERLLPDDFALKAELTYVDFGKTRFSTPVTSVGSPEGSMNFSSEQRLGIFTIGLEKKF